jgi:zinc transporter, ZIP family
MAVPAVVALAGGVLAALWKPSRSARSLVQHFAAGVVLSALAVELLPEIEREHAPALVLVAAFAAGSLFMFGLKLGTDRRERRDAGTLALGLVLATFVDVAMDGFIIGAGFAAGGGAGTVLAVGLSVELLFLGLSLTSDSPGGWRIVLLSAGLGGVVLVGAVVGKLALGHAPTPVIGAALAFAVAALLYLVTEELLMEAHEHPESPASTLVLFGGFLAFWSVSLVGG